MERTQKLAVLVSCSDHYAARTYLYDEYLKARGFEVIYITSDFHHTRKETFTCAVPGAVQLHVRPYQKNLSPDRILSHRDFARAVYRYLEQLSQVPQLIIGDVPPNFLAKYLAKYKRRHPETRLIFDIFDLWPETFPSGSAKKLLKPVFDIWGSLRDRALPAADLIFTECDMFRQRLCLEKDPRARTLYLAGIREDALDLTPALPHDRLSLCYLGAINNIIDIPAIEDLVRELVQKTPVTVHVIGEGERRHEFLDALARAGAETVYHGALYGAEEKQAIMAKCHMGLNIMKSTVCIGLTMKSVDYWCHDLPIISSIGADTARLIEENRMGLNLESSTADALAALTAEDFLAMRQNVHRVFDNTFRKEVILGKLSDALKELL